MNNFFDDTMQGLLQAVEIEKGNIPLAGRKGMAAPTYYIPDGEKALIDQFVEIRKRENVSQAELASMIGSKQQAISRLESKEHSPSLKLFYSMLDALGYELVIEKKATV